MPVADPVLVATIGRPHGVRGETRLRSFTSDPLAVGGYGPLRAADGREFRLERLRPGKDVLVAKFAGVDDRDAAEALNGLDLYLARDSLPPASEEDEFYHADLLGLAAVSEAGEPQGAVVAVHNFGAGDILEIAPPRGPTLLVPFTRTAVPAIDIAARRIVIAPPPSEDGGDPDAGAG